MAMDSSDSDAELMKVVPRIHRKCPQKDEPVKRPQTGGRMLSATNSKNIQDVPSDTEGDAIGANENAEELRSQDMSGMGPVPVWPGSVSTGIDPMHRGLASLEGPPSLLSQRPKRSLQGLYRD